jgi:hypothetical protein
MRLAVGTTKKYTEINKKKLRRKLKLQPITIDSFILKQVSV